MSNKVQKKSDSPTKNDDANNAMRTPAKEIKDALWRKLRGEFEHPALMFVNLGFKPDKKAKKTAKDCEVEAWMGLLELAYKTGLDRGYDMGAEVFGAADVERDAAERDTAADRDGLGDGPEEE